MFGSLRWHDPDQVQWVYSQLSYLVQDNTPVQDKITYFLFEKKIKTNEQALENLLPFLFNEL